MFKFTWLNRKPKERKPKQLTKEEKKSSLELKADDLPLGTKIKRCPKCHRNYKVEAIICECDSTLLMLTAQEFPILSEPITAARGNGTPLEFLCTRTIGKGNMCSVFDAHDTATQQRYAIKILSGELVHDAKSAKKFLAGAHTTLTLQHENIVQLHAIGDIPTSDPKCNLPLVVCEYLEGKALSSMIGKDNLPAVAEVLEISSQVCKALDHAHKKGIIHGDLKPNNIYVVAEGEKQVTKVCDFAVAERLFRGLEWDIVTTMTTSLYGCALYLAPDFIDARELAVVTDIYSLGCIMYECLTGQPPFIIGNDFGIMMAHRDQAPKPFSAEYTPKAVADIVMKALEKDPRKRWQSATEMCAAIELCKANL